MHNLEFEHFTDSRKLRDKFCQNKDSVLLPILNSIQINNSKSFHALLMPCLYGSEAYFLQNKGIPTKNIFALERNHKIHQEILNCKYKDRQILKGMHTTAIPLPASQGIDRARLLTTQYDLIYLDFFGQPEYKEHYDCVIKKIFELDMLKKDSTLILTFGKTRCSHNVKLVNEVLLDAFKNHDVKNVPTQVLVGAAIKETGYRLQKEMYDRHYLSIGGNNRRLQYVTTVVKF